MAYFGGGAQPVIDWEARDQLYQLRDAITKLTARVAELEAALKARDDHSGYLYDATCPGCRELREKVAAHA